MPFQVAVEGQRAPGRVVDLKPGANIVGRSPKADIRLEAGLVSRQHARITVEESGAVVVQDMDSHNGTFVNGEKVRTRVVNPGDRIYVGGYCLTLETPSRAEDAFAVEGRLARASVPEMLVRALDLGRLGESPGFTHPEATLRHAAILARTIEVFARTAPAAEFELRMLSLVRDLLGAESVALILADDKDQLDVRQYVVDAGQPAPAVSWVVARKALSERSAYFSREFPLDPDLVEGQASSQRTALLAVPLVADPHNPALGLLQTTRPHRTSGYADHEVTVVMGLCHLLAQRISQGSTSTDVEPERAVVGTEITLTSDGTLTREMVHHALVQSLPDELAERILAHAEGQESPTPPVRFGEQAVAYFQLHGFEQWAREHTPAQAVELLGQVHPLAIMVAMQFGGRMDQPLGAGGYLRFWEGKPTVMVDAALRALAELRTRLQPVLEAPGLPLQLRAGVDVGQVMAGVFGDGARATYTLVGESARVAEQVAQMAGAGELCITGAVKARLGQQGGWRLVALGPHALRGHPEVVDLYRVDTALAEGE